MIYIFLLALHILPYVFDALLVSAHMLRTDMSSCRTYSLSVCNVSSLSLIIFFFWSLFNGKWREKESDRKKVSIMGHGIIFWTHIYNKQRVLGKQGLLHFLCDTAVTFTGTIATCFKSLDYGARVSGFEFQIYYL